MRVDRFKVMHWMNVRKITPGQVAEQCDLSAAALGALLDGGDPEVTETGLSTLAAALAITADQLVARATDGLAAVVRTGAELHATRRPIQRAGLHFYNYYSMAAPPGRVAPVILDILCPAGTLPALNNGHLEPAITINLGPGDIYGRWGTELTPATWEVLRASTDGPDAWIVGDSYVEPSYCPHSYGLTGDTPARIVSYTGAANLAGLLEEVNGWTDAAFDELTDDLREAPPAAAALAAILARRGYDPSTAGKAADLPVESVAAFAGGDPGALGLDELQALGAALSFDYRVLLPARHRRDSAGKTCLTARESRASTRPFESYTVASVAMASELPDLVGLFMLVNGDAGRLDLCDQGETHYLVTGGQLTLRWRGDQGQIVSADLGPDGTAWVGPHVRHAWSGSGSLIKLGSGQHPGYLDQLELTNTFAPADTLRRGRHDAQGWGYETDVRK